MASWSVQLFFRAHDRKQYTDTRMHRQTTLCVTCIAIGCIYTPSCVVRWLL